MIEDSQKSVNDKVNRVVLDPYGLREDDYRFITLSDLDRPGQKKTLPLKSDDDVKQEYKDKCEYFKHVSLIYDLDLVEIDCREFISWIFERRVDYLYDVSPFEDKMSSEYQNWLEQKKDGKTNIDYRGYACWRYNPIVFYSENKKGYHRIILKDDEETLDFLDGRKFALLAPITYVGRNNISLNARYLYAIGFDLDGVGTKQIDKLVMMMQDEAIPMANIITNSGHGLHLYYLLKEPIPLYKENLPLLNKLKHGLTNVIWNDRTSFIEDRQYQSILQGFRLPGTMTKFGMPIKSYYNLDSSMYTLGQLNNFLSRFKLTDEELNQITQAPVYNPTSVTREEAKRLWPEWYAARVLQHKWIGNKWHVKRDVYDWWLNKLRTADEEIKVHHRYWCILTLIVYAVKCDISKDEVRADAYSLVSKFDSYTDSDDNHFSTDDVDDAMQAYDENYNKWPIHTIESTTTFHIERNRRNGRKQDEHLRRARLLRDADHPNGSWRGNGRKSEAEKVRLWREEHPGIDNKSLCARETGLTRPTVIKWWNPESVKVKVKPVVDIKPEDIIINVVKLFAPGSTYTVDGLDMTNDELREFVTSGKAVSLGYEIVY